MSMDFGLTSVDIDSAHLFNLVATNCREFILLADSSKFDSPSLYKITDFSALSTVVTEKSLSPDGVISSHSRTLSCFIRIWNVNKSAVKVKKQE